MNVFILLTFLAVSNIFLKPSCAFPKSSPNLHEVSNIESNLMQKGKENRQRMLHFNLNFQDELQELQDVDPKVNDPLAKPYKFEKPTQNRNESHLNYKVAVRKMYQNSSQVRLPLLTEKVMEGKKYLENVDVDTRTQFLQNESNSSKFSVLVKDTAGSILKVGDSNTKVENEKGFKTNRTMTPTLTHNHLFTSTSHPLNENDSQRFQNHLIKTERKSEDCLETQFYEPTPSTFVSNRQLDTVQKPNRVKESILLYNFLKQSSPSSSSSSSSSSNLFNPRPLTPSKVEKLQTASTVIGILVASVFVTIAAAWMTIGETSLRTLEHQQVNDWAYPRRVQPLTHFYFPRDPSSRSL